MSVYTFIHRGHHYGKIGVLNVAVVYGSGAVAELFDVDDPTYIGALYPDKARQIQPISWLPNNSPVRIALDDSRRGERISQSLSQEQRTTGEKPRERPHVGKPKGVRPRVGSGRPKVNTNSSRPRVAVQVNESRIRARVTITQRPRIHFKKGAS